MLACRTLFMKRVCWSIISPAFLVAAPIAVMRDASSAGEDLSTLMKSRAGGADASSVGALLFSCNGRGSRMFETKNHDIGCIQDAFTETVPAAGFFAMGEIGPVGGRNFLHGFTASVAVFRSRD